MSLFVVSILFLATLIRSTLGFGEALFAVPVLAFVLPVKVAAPLAVLVSITVAVAIIAQDWRQVHIGGAATLVAWTLPGIPVGLLILREVPEPMVKGVLGVLVAGFALSALRTGGTRELHDDRRAWIFGFAAGVLGGAYGMNGPPLVIYGALRRWSAAQFRATLQGYFLPAGLVGMAGYGASGLWTADVNRYFLTSLPLVAAAIVLGRAIHRRFHADRFRTAVHLALAASGAGLIVQALRSFP